MLSWIARAILIAAGTVVSWFIARTEPYFVTAEIAAVLVLFVLAVLALALGPAHWRRKLRRRFFKR